jgi:hypothetical protein
LPNKVCEQGALPAPCLKICFDDINANGVQEPGVAARSANGKVHLQIRDAASGATTSSINIP